MKEDTKVYINCPYDNDYAPIKYVLLFTILSCGMTPKLASMDKNVGKSRMEKIKELVTMTKYSIHDISRCKAPKKNSWYKMNMPFELGFDFSSKFFSKKMSDKQYLVLTGGQYNMRHFFSDFMGYDTFCYGESAEKLIGIVRNFFWSVLDDSKKKLLPSKTDLWNRYQQFQLDLYDNSKTNGINLQDLEDEEFCEMIKLFNSSR